MPLLLAIDAGGTSTRAVTLDRSGRCFGYGRAGSGNPTASGVASAVAAIARATEHALAASSSGPGASVGVIAMAGQRSAPFVREVSARLAGLGVGRVILQPDLLGIFHSGTPAPDGYALIAGTGTVAARIQDGTLARVVGGRGWLLGDAGSGFWIGHRVARAVIAALDGQAPTTALTDLVLASVGIPAPPDSPAGREQALNQLVTALYARPPVQLSAFAPLAFRAHRDPVAREILVGASSALAHLTSVVRIPALTGPLVVGGSVLIRGLLAAPPDLRGHLVLPAHEDEVIPVSDGVVGAAVLALRSADTDVDATLFRELQLQVTQAATVRGAENPAGDP
jgi:N-acetylglucosamine kinase-like BadF-type ATPase